MSNFFKAHAHAIPSSFGGGWIIPKSPRGECVLRSFFGEQAAFQAPIQETGWMIEPWQVNELVEYLQGVSA